MKHEKVGEDGALDWLQSRSYTGIYTNIKTGSQVQRRRRSTLDWLSLPSIPQRKRWLGLVLLQHFCPLIFLRESWKQCRVLENKLVATSFAYRGPLSTQLWSFPKAHPSKRGQERSVFDFTEQNVILSQSLR